MRFETHTTIASKYCSLILLGGSAVQKMYDLSKALPYPQLSTNSDQVQAIKNN